MWAWDKKKRKWYCDPTEEELKRVEEENKLLEVIEEHCKWYNSGKLSNVWCPSAIANPLIRAGIRTLDDLKNADEGYIARIRGIGKTRFALIMTIKLSLE